MTDATVTLGDLAVEHDTYLPGRYRVQQQCAEPTFDAAAVVAAFTAQAFTPVAIGCQSCILGHAPSAVRVSGFDLP